MEVVEYDHFTSIRKSHTEIDATGCEVDADSRPVGRLYALGHVVFVQPKKIKQKGRGRTAATVSTGSRGGAVRAAPATAPAYNKQARNCSESEESQEDSEGSEGSGAEEAGSLQPGTAEELTQRSKSGRPLAPPPWRSQEDAQEEQRQGGRGRSLSSAWGVRKSCGTAGASWRSLQADAAEELARCSKRDPASKREWPDPPREPRGGAATSPPNDDGGDGDQAFYPRPRGRWY